MSQSFGTEPSEWPRLTAETPRPLREILLESPHVDAVLEKALAGHDWDVAIGMLRNMGELFSVVGNIDNGSSGSIVKVKLNEGVSSVLEGGLDSGHVGKILQSEHTERTLNSEHTERTFNSGHVAGILQSEHAERILQSEHIKSTPNTEHNTESTTDTRSTLTSSVNNRTMSQLSGRSESNASHASSSRNTPTPCTSHGPFFVLKVFIHTDKKSPDEYNFEAVNEYLVLRAACKHSGSSQWLVPVYGLVNEPASSSLAMILDFYPHGDLLSLLARARRHKIEVSQDFIDMAFFKVFLAVKFLHSCQIVHRDIKPENVLIDFNGQLRLADFGYAVDLNRVRDYRLDGTFLSLGTRSFKAPELFRYRRMGEQLVDAKDVQFASIDVWSLGVLYYQLRTLSKPWIEATPADASFRAFEQIHDRVAGSNLDGYAIRKLLSSNTAIDRGFSKLTRDETVTTLLSLLDPDPRRRASIRQLGLTEWMIQLRQKYEEAKKARNSLRDDDVLRLAMLK